MGTFMCIELVYGNIRNIAYILHVAKHDNNCAVIYDFSPKAIARCG